jgi:RNA polymerase primary sigma factor
MSKKDRKVGSDSNRALSKYLEEIGKFEPLTPNEEIDLAQRLRSGDRDALKKLTESNLRL